MPRKDPARVGRVNVFDEVRHAKATMRSAKPSRRSRRNKLRSDIPGTASLTREPKLTPEYAHEFVKLLHAGIPRDSILAYFAPDHFASLREKGRHEWLMRWANSPLMARASAAFNKGQWQDLDKDSRLTLALDKHMAELAYFLYTTNYDKAEGTAFKKVVDARTAIMQYMEEGEGDADTPFMRAMRDLLAGNLSKDDGDGPPRMGESIPTERIPKKISES